MKILMVCIGNICRSPIAEGILQQKIDALKLSWQVDSAGTSGYHNGEAPHPDSIKVCRLNNIDISAQKSRPFIIADFDNFDKIYALAIDVYLGIKKMARNESDMQKVDFLLNEISSGSNQSVKDPWYGTYTDYEDVFDEIGLACEAIIERYK